MALSVVQSVKADIGSGFSTTLTLPAVNIAAGNLVVIFGRASSSATISSISPGTWTVRNAGGTGGMKFYFADIQNHPGGSGIVYTVTWSANISGAWVCLIEIAGAATSSAVDIQDTGNTAGTVPIASAGYTTTQADEIILGAVGVNANGGSTPTWTMTPGFTLRETGLSSGPILGAVAVFTSIVSSIQTGVSASGTFTGGPPTGQTLGVIQLISYKAVAAAGHSISGNAGVAGATISYTGTASGSVVADGSGNYSIPSLADGSYTLTPSKTGYTFSPVSSNQTMAGSNITGVNFVATPVVVAVPLQPMVPSGVPTLLRSALSATADIPFSFSARRKGGDFSAQFYALGTVILLTASLQVSLDGSTWTDYIAAANFISNTVPIKMIKPLIAGAQYRIHATAVTGPMDLWVVTG